MLEKEFEYYVDHQKQLVEKYRGRYIVVIADKMVGDYSSEAEVYAESVKKYQLGTFFIQQVLPGPESYNINFHTRVYLNH